MSAHILNLPVFIMNMDSKCLYTLYIIVVPYIRRIRHVDIIGVSKCFHVWMGEGKGDVWGWTKG
jgi:hypothetical protein